MQRPGYRRRERSALVVVPVCVGVCGLVPLLVMPF
jgi:hypothetical protein